MAQRHVMTAAGLFAALLAGAGSAMACEFYEAIDTRTELFDKPDSGAGLAVAILPEATQACVMEETADPAGQKWYRLGFYTVANVKYNVDGWVRAQSGAAAPAGGPQIATVTGPAPDAARSEVATPESGQKEAFFSKDWTLDNSRSRLNFVTIKKGTVVETQTFGELSGTISSDGGAEVKIKLESVSTGIDIRDVRMRFLLFDIEQFPEATITARIDPQAIGTVFDEARMAYDLPVTLTIRGISKDITVPVIISKLGDGLVSVASASPVTVSATDFGMDDGLKQLSSAVGDISITPSSPVTFELAFVPTS
ncbi:YceI family protein [Jiella pacifica]|uniref:Lipid/polyisoprenoid-binding YceI-like domain-containing protein n=1 Tax=Jiella pacifica TaxID=2696469 RepID=A0A6N9TDM2_9HYPH|nr:YceI family protein [Jiella pacifica]NDW06968.1 hypothetical protein [Jiella pacifica]